MEPVLICALSKLLALALELAVRVEDPRPIFVWLLHHGRVAEVVRERLLALDIGKAGRDELVAPGHVVPRLERLAQKLQQQQRIQKLYTSTVAYTHISIHSIRVDAGHIRSWMKPYPTLH